MSSAHPALTYLRGGGAGKLWGLSQVGDESFLRLLAS